MRFSRYDIVPSLAKKTPLNSLRGEKKTGAMMGLEPTTPGITNRCPNKLIVFYAAYVFSKLIFIFVYANTRNKSTG